MYLAFVAIFIVLMIIRFGFRLAGYRLKPWLRHPAAAGIASISR